MDVSYRGWGRAHPWVPRTLWRWVITSPSRARRGGAEGWVGMLGLVGAEGLGGSETREEGGERELRRCHSVLNGIVFGER